jgi:glutamate carboxypeptidase
MTVMNDTQSIGQVSRAVEDQDDWLKKTLRQLVEIESPSDTPAAVNLANEFVAELAAGMGARVKRHKQKAFGDVMELRFGPRRARSSQIKQKPVMLLGHLDTVWPMGTLKSMPWREADGRLWGPGVLDMKAGVVMALAAIKSLKELGIERPVTMLLNSDEEVGSTVSRPITERLAVASSAVFVLEPAQGLAYKTARKGVGQYELHLTGVAAHSGVDFAKGHSAIREMARLIETVSGFTDLKRGRTVNCGVVRGGTRSNVIAEHAYAEVDVRIARASDAARVDKLFRSLKVTDKGCRLEVTGGINRPPMERTAGTVALFKAARGIAAEMGFALEEAATGGGSDGNFTSALGVATLDGMGAVGEGAHAAHESVVIEHLVPRTALLAAMVARG